MNLLTPVFMPRHKTILQYLDAELFDTFRTPAVKQIAYHAQCCELTARRVVRELISMDYLYEYELGKKHLWLTQKGQQYVRSL